MTAINVAFERDCVWLMTDGAVYTDEGLPLAFTQKAIALPTLHAAMASQGQAIGLGVLAQVMGSVYRDFDDLMDRIEGHLYAEFDQVIEREGGIENVTPFRLALVGWSQRHDCAQGFGFDTTASDPFSVFDNAPGDWAMMPTLSPAEERNLEDQNVLRNGFEFVGRFDPARHGVAVMEAQRRMPIVPLVSKTGAEIPIVGGFVLSTEITREGVTQRILHRWNDDVGRVIQPEEFVAPVNVAKLNLDRAAAKRARKAAKLQRIAL